MSLTGSQCKEAIGASVEIRKKMKAFQRVRIDTTCIFCLRMMTFKCLKLPLADLLQMKTDYQNWVEQFS